jgi:hypothetical protein
VGAQGGTNFVDDRTVVRRSPPRTTCTGERRMACDLRAMVLPAMSARNSQPRCSSVSYETIYRGCSSYIPETENILKWRVRTSVSAVSGVGGRALLATCSSSAAVHTSHGAVTRSAHAIWQPLAIAFWRLANATLRLANATLPQKMIKVMPIGDRLIAIEFRTLARPSVSSSSRGAAITDGRGALGPVPPRAWILHGGAGSVVQAIESMARLTDCQ